MENQLKLTEDKETMKRKVRHRRKFSTRFKIETAMQVLRGEKSNKDFVDTHGERIYYGNVEIWVYELLAGKYGTKYAGMFTDAKTLAKYTRRPNHPEPKKVAEPTVQATTTTTDTAALTESFKELIGMFATTLKKANQLELENDRLKADPVARYYAEQPRYIDRRAPQNQDSYNRLILSR